MEGIVYQKVRIALEISFSTATTQDLLRTITDQNTISHYSNVIMGAMASRITSLVIVYWTVYSGAD